MSKKTEVLRRLRTALAKGPCELRGLGRPDAAFVLEAKIRKADAAYQRLVSRVGEAAAEGYLNRKLAERGWCDRV